VLSLLVLISFPAVGLPAGASGLGKDERDGADAKLVFVRDAGSGIRIRVHDADVSRGFGPQFVGPGGVFFAGGPGPGSGSAACQPRRSLLVGLSTDAAVGQGGGWLLARRNTPALVFVTSGGFGVTQGEPVVWVALQTSKRVASVRADFAGGDADEMKPTDGIAVLASKLRANLGRSAEQTGPLGKVRALDADGQVIGRIRLGPTLSYETGTPEDCRAPSLESTFPPATGPPPADADAARLAIINAYETAYSPGPTREQKLASLEDGDALIRAYDAGVAANPQYAGQVAIRVGEVRFVNRRRAAVMFTLVAAGTDVLVDQIGRAKLIDGRWLVARDTFCTLLSFGGIDCADPQAARANTRQATPLEGVRILVLNGSDVAQGAAVMANMLRGYGYAISSTGDTASQTGTTVACSEPLGTFAQGIADTIGPDTTIVPYPDPQPVEAINTDCIVTRGN